jgi:DNA-directed RNA polymerase subunit H (RpoH/RPB5)
MNSETIDILYRSRITLLDHLETDGYDTTPYRKFSPKEISEMVKAGPVLGAPPALMMELQRKEPVEGKHNKCLIVYTLGKIKQKLVPFTTKIIENEEGGSTFDASTTELIIITLEVIAPNFHTTALMCYNNHKAKVRFFQAAAIINNPLKHFLVPNHARVPAEEEEELLKGLYAKKSQLPFIRFHEDPVARIIGLVPGEIVKITRPSLTAGECIGYRVCVP